MEELKFIEAMRAEGFEVLEVDFEIDPGGESGSYVANVTQFLPEDGFVKEGEWFMEGDEMFFY